VSPFLNKHSKAGMFFSFSKDLTLFKAEKTDAITTY
jgi:hypothetical protein